MSALIWSPLPDEEAARALANNALAEGIVACANIIPGMQSLFVWNGEQSEGTECGVLFKTDSALLAQAVERIEDLHPYETPAVLGWHCDTAGEAAKAWLSDLPGRKQ